MVKSDDDSEGAKTRAKGRMGAREGSSGGKVYGGMKILQAA